MDDKSFLNMDIAVLEKMYQSYKASDEEMSDSWKHFFQGFDLAVSHYGDKNSIESLDVVKEFDVISLINAYRKRGHFFTKTNPVRARRKYFPTLDIENFNLTKDDLETEFNAGKLIGLERTKLKNILDALEQTYCSNIGAEYMFIRQPEVVDWLKNKMEAQRNQPGFSNDEKKHIFSDLNRAVGFEQFIHKRFVGQKRFSLEGGESLIPALSAIIEKGAELGVKEFVLGMSHRGRLNVLTNIMKKAYHNIFEEFNGKRYETGDLPGDVKYHLGYTNKIKTNLGHEVQLNLLPNPSHLELVAPVVTGVAKAKINRKYKGQEDNVLPIVIHGDAAVSGQGVVYETVQMSQLEGYHTGGTIHLVVNNQIGFTTNYLDGRSSTYCTDIAKVIKAPVFHVNSDAPESLIYVIQLAMEYRQIFHTDVFIDILGYRRHGHNEGDEPRFTQPVLYKAISKHPNVRDLYAEKLKREGVMTAAEIKAEMNDYDEFLDNQLELANQKDSVIMHQFLSETWKDWSVHDVPKLSIDELKDLSERLTKLPKDEKFLKKIQKLVETRAAMIDNGSIDWGMAEHLAYASLLKEGMPIRLSGQDSVRGTFTHRHSSFFIEDSRDSYTPLANISFEQANFSVYNSPLSELGVLGFEYGYALATPKGLTIWEAQFGDFSNMAQPIFDQYISSAEAKWGLHNGLVMLLPHGYEGQGAEHSSARIERYMDLAVDNNLHIIYPTTPENIYHALRNHVYQDFSRPMIAFTPKSLLRHPKAVCSAEALSEGDFQEIIDKNNPEPKDVTQLVVTTGKLYYQVMEKRDEIEANHVAVVSLEQLFPFPEKRFNEVLMKYSNAELRVFAQDEPANMGVYNSIYKRLDAAKFELVSRPASSSPAPGLSELHLKQEYKIINEIFQICDYNWEDVISEIRLV